jgi:ribose transport system permease protein
MSNESNTTLQAAATNTATPTDPAASTPSQGPALWLRGVRWIGSSGLLLVIWALVILAFSLIEPSTFLQTGTFRTIFNTPVQLIFLTLALVITFAVGEFDLSVAAVMGIGGTLVAFLNVNHGMNPWIASLIALAVGAAVGLANGLLIVILGVNPIVVTLGLGTFITGVALWITDLNVINGLPSSFSNAANQPVGGVSISFVYGLVLTLVLAYLLNATPLGLRISFVGANREVARLAGIRVARIRVGAYIASGLISSLGGVILAATLGGFNPSSSPNYLLPAFAAVFLGTAVIQPGKFNAIGAFVGIFFLQTGIVGLQLLGLTGYIENLFYGGTLVVAVTISTIVQRRSTR